MTCKAFAQLLGLTALTGECGLDREITGFYAGDLLSWVMSHASKGQAWVTVHTHINIVAVAVLTEIACIILPEGLKADDNTVKKAIEEGIPVFSSELSTFELCWKAHDLLEAALC